MAETPEEFFSDFKGTKIQNEAVLVHEYLAGTTTVQAATQRMVESLKLRDAPKNAGQYDTSEIIESIIVAAAQKFPETHAALVTLLGALKQESETSNSSDSEKSLSYALDEVRLRYGDPDPNEEWRNDVRNEWTNLNHFAALIYQAKLQDLSYFAVETLWMALRREGWRVNWVAQNTSDTIVALEGHAPAAAQWILVCGQQLHDESSEVREKWVNWRGNLVWMVGQAELNAEIKSLCQQALAEMRRISA